MEMNKLEDGKKEDFEHMSKLFRSKGDEELAQAFDKMAVAIGNEDGFEQMNECLIRDGENLTSEWKGESKVKKGSSGSTWERDEDAVGLGNVLNDTSKDMLDRFFDSKLPKKEEGVKRSRFKDPDEVWTSEQFLDNSGVHIDGNVVDEDMFLDKEAYLEDDDIRPLEELSKPQKAYKYMRWYEKILFRIKNFFLFVWTYWSVKKEREERLKFREDLCKALDMPRSIVSPGLNRSVISARTLPTTVELEQKLNKRKQEELAVFGSVGRVARRK